MKKDITSKINSTSKHSYADRVRTVKVDKACADMYFKEIDEELDNLEKKKRGY